MSDVDLNFIKQLKDNFLLFGAVKRILHLKKWTIICSPEAKVFLGRSGMDIASNKFIDPDVSAKDLEELALHSKVLIFTPNEEKFFSDFKLSNQVVFFVRDVVFAKKVFRDPKNLLATIFSVKSGEIPKIKTSKAILIFSLPRGGSTFFSDTFGQSGRFGNPVEHIQHDIVDLIKLKVITLKEYMDYVFNYSATENGVVTTKIIDGWVLNIYKDENTHEYIHNLLNQHTIVYLERKNKISQSVSAYKSRTTKQFHSTGAKPKDQVKVKYDFDQILKIHSMYVRKEDILKSFFKKVLKSPPYHVLYEDFCKDPQKYFFDISKYAKVKVARSSFKTSKYVKVSDENSKKLV